MVSGNFVIVRQIDIHYHTQEQQDGSAMDAPHILRNLNRTEASVLQIGLVRSKQGGGGSIDQN